MHPYEIRQTMLARKHDRVVNMPGGSLYSTIDRLVADGLIQAIGTHREGRRPERTVYDLTSEGETVLLNWLRESIAIPEPEHSQSATIMAFLPHFTPMEAASLLRERLSRLKALDSEEREMLQEPFWTRLPRLFRVHDEYVTHMRGAELEWLESLIRNIETGAITWPQSIIDLHKRRGTWVDDHPTSGESPTA
jgi:DNA-binding PadR family transcriptional regulator